MAEWVMKKLKDIADFNPRESLAKGTVAKKIGMDKLQPFCRDVPGYELEPFSGGTKFRNGDTIMARITPCLENGKTAKVSILDDGEVGFGSTEYIVFRAKDGVDEDFIYYLVCSPLVREPAIKSMVGSSGRQRVQTDVVQNLEIMVPDYEEQRRISGLLKSLDDKIAVNTEVNKNLQDQMEALHRSWFIDYAPFGGTKPSNWIKSDIYSIANIIYGAPFASKLFNTEGLGKPIIRIRDLKEQTFVTYTTEIHPKG
ncbi:MAG: restriction endonuclease subunit S, partial [Staphylococcus sp.]|nr:restriction endonuclease subunit S [Staphylococcus sp.]